MKAIFIVFLLVTIAQIELTYSQNTSLFGIVENKLVTIDTISAKATVFKVVENMPENELLSDISFHVGNQLFYGFRNPTSSPQLISISLDGDYQVVGSITYNGVEVKMAETLAYSPLDNVLYAAVSVSSGPAQGDFWSETIMEIDPYTAECKYITTLKSSRINPEADVMAISSEKLFIFDGAPSPENFLDFAELELSNINASVSLIYQSSYLAIRGFTIIGNNIYLVDSNRILRKFNLLSDKLHTIGQTHANEEFGGNVIMGLSKASICSVPDIDLGGNINACEDEVVLLDASHSDIDSYEWQDGSREPTFRTNEPGIYWVKVTNSCGVDQDTVSLSFDSFPVVDLGEDREICNSEPLVLDATFPGSSTVWQDGSTNPLLYVRESGTYWVNIGNSCGTTSDSISVLYTSIPKVDLGKDLALCDGQTLFLDVSFPGASYRWHDGSENPEFLVDRPGVYWVYVTNSCGVGSDSLSVTEITNESIPNVITPNKDEYNQYFEIDQKLMGARLEVFNRWGGLVFQSNDYRNDWAGSGLSPGVYYYQIKSEYCTFKGVISIIY